MKFAVNINRQNSYSTNRKWSDQFIPSIKQIVGPYLLEPSSMEVDMREATDLVVLRARDMSIACRVRRQGYADKYPYDFTIRAKLDSGASTEFAKIVCGWGDWMLYGHEGPNASLSRWWLMDLHEFRAELIRDGNRETRRLPPQTTGNMINNFDGTSFFAYDVRLFGPKFLIASSHIIENEAQLDFQDRRAI